MIHTTLNVLKEKFNERLSVISDLVMFIDNNNTPITPKNKTIAPFLMNISKDRKFRNLNHSTVVVLDGVRTQMNPEIRVELRILFVSKFNDYNQALQLLPHNIIFSVQ